MEQLAAKILQYLANIDNSQVLSKATLLSIGWDHVVISPDLYPSHGWPWLELRCPTTLARSPIGAYSYTFPIKLYSRCYRRDEC